MLSTRLRYISDCLPSGVRLLAVSKGQPVTSIRSLAEIGQCDFGESRLQEASPKLNALQEFKNLRWHFIGRLQSNKVRSVVKSFQFIHSVDSFSLAERISRISGEEKCSPMIMLQVKFREDPTKGGFSPQQLLDEWLKLNTLPNLKLVGLMTMVPINLDCEDRRNVFRDCRALADQLNLPDCSMGMSSDWKEALQCGATWLRVGSALFGDDKNHVISHTDITKSD
ncbi:YggS family pyridoxal phosphate-dependent enzyme [Prochlorococcus sp. MIT 1307]|uniref:YggS family pyridoxal phosphate-dependent enzyme n=1 Tax=Prochlorococcus sp. MIT 1307 TaxID=3096219 RepID=UPI002A75E7C7|nr:YggS family pyridoxal phosphate-dependent enzyme [Prochlorococcus sp. MIT 1307]